jgi:hypothetical protein
MCAYWLILEKNLTSLLLVVSLDITLDNDKCYVRLRLR